MANNNFYARIQQKIDTEENWNKAVNFVPLKGEIIIYDIDSAHDYKRIKIGDGVTTVINLEFVADISVYDTDSDGVVDNAAKLGGKTPGQLTFGANQIITDESTDERLAETLDEKMDKAGGNALIGGTDIPANSDLNSYTQPGNYGCYANEAAATLVNCPMSSAFILRVFASSVTGTWQYRWQELMPIHGSQNYSYLRRCGSSDGGITWNWDEWQTPMPKSGGVFTGDVKLNGGLDISSFRDCSNVPFKEIAAGKGTFLINWSSANSPNANTLLGISDGWTAIAMSYTGEIYVTTIEKTAWEVMSVSKSGGTFTGDAVHFNNYRANVGSWYGSNTDHNAHLATVGEDGLISQIAITDKMEAVLQQWKDGQYIKGAKVMTDAGGTFTGTVYASTTPRQGGNQLRGIWVGNSSWASVDTVEIQMIRK